MKNAIVNLFKTLFFFDVVAVAVFFLPYREKNTAAGTALSKEILFLSVVVVLTVVFFFLIERGKVKILNFKNIFRHYSIGLLCGMLPIAVTVLFLWFTKHIHFAKKEEITGILTWLAALFVNTLATELLFRGYLFRLYRKYYSFPVSACLISLLFFSMNYPFLHMGKTYVLNLLMLNLILCLTADETHSFSAPLAGHLVYRLISGFALGSFRISEDYPCLFDISVSGNIHLTGGAKGLEGSLILLVMQTLVVIWFARKRMKSVKLQLPDFVCKFLQAIRREKRKGKTKKTTARS